jgi:hypothetical protein
MRAARYGCKALFMAALAVTLLIALAACAPSLFLPAQPLDAAALEKAESGQMLNAIRFVTIGPVSEQVFGYFLYRDGFEAATGGGANIVHLGKMSVAEVQADYERMMRSRQYTRGSSLQIREILYEGAPAGYTLADINVELTVWKRASVGNQQGRVLQVVFADKRGQSSGGKDRTFSGD